MTNPTIQNFQQSRARFIRLTKMIGAVIVLSFLAMVIILSMKLGDDVAIFAFIPFFLSIIAWVLVAYAVYRCPACGAVPMTASSGSSRVDLNPLQCRKCGAALRDAG